MSCQLLGTVLSEYALRYNRCCLSGLQAAFLNQDNFASVRRLKLHIMRETKDFLTALKLPFDEMVPKVSLFESWANGTCAHVMHM